MTEPTHPALARAQLLMERRRFGLAEEELRRGLRDEPENAGMHAYLALCLGEDPARGLEAMDTAIRATVYEPNAPFSWYALSVVASRHGTARHAESAGRAALALAPATPELLAHMAELMANGERLREGLEFAEQALAVAPDEARVLTTAGTVRSRLGRHAQAKADFARALARAPESEPAHTQAGWAALRRRDSEAAIEHFRTSLGLDPEHRRARHGLLEAHRARSHPGYRVFLPVALRFHWIGPQVKWVAVAFAILLAGWAVTIESPLVRLPVQAAVIAAAVFTWTAHPLADLALLRDPAGRALLDRTARVVAVAVSALLCAAAVLGIAWAAGAPRGTGMAAILAVLLTVPVTAIPRAAPGWPRAVQALYAVLLVIPATLAVLHQAGRTPDAGTWFGIAAGGLAFSDFIAEFLPRRR